MEKGYPVVRDPGPPDFLAQKYTDVPTLLKAALQEGGIKAAEVDNTVFKGFEDAFRATDEQLLRAVAPSLKDLTGDVRVQAGNSFLYNVKLLMIFENITEVRAAMRPRFIEAIQSMPRTLTELEVSGGGRDLLDPFIVAFDMRLLSRGSLEGLLHDLLAHKCLMKMEDLIGHLHEEVLGRAAGKQRVPEPDGVPEPGPGGKMVKNKEKWHPELNPYPGSDARYKELEFYQIKSKTGSAKGSDGEKLGRQFRTLSEKYPDSKRYYVAMVGKTLAGHRSMGAFLRTDPQAVCLVGLAAFQELGHHRETAKIVLELYLNEFEKVSAELDFDFNAIVTHMAEEWRVKHGGGDPAHRLLEDTITVPNPAVQSSETYGRRASQRDLLE